MRLLFESFPSEAMRCHSQPFPVGRNIHLIMCARREANSRDFVVRNPVRLVLTAIERRSTNDDIWLRVSWILPPGTLRSVELHQRTGRESPVQPSWAALFDGRDHFVDGLGRHWFGQMRIESRVERALLILRLTVPANCDHAAPTQFRRISQARGDFIAVDAG